MTLKLNQKNTECTVIDALGVKVGQIASSIVFSIPEPLLVITSGRHRVDTDLVSIGRDPQSDIFLDDITVSRKHAQLKKKSEYLVEDLNSLNGTYINSKSVSKASLSNGDELQIGKYRLTFFVANEK